MRTSGFSLADLQAAHTQLGVYLARKYPELKSNSVPSPAQLHAALDLFELSEAELSQRVAALAPRERLDASSRSVDAGFNRPLPAAAQSLHGAAFLLALPLEPAHVAAVEAFDANEFVNPFLPVFTTEATPEVAALMRKKVEAAACSILSRVTAPVVLNNSTLRAPLFALAQREAQAIDPNARVMPSGGVARAALGYITSLVSSSETYGEVVRRLDAIATDTSTLDAHDALGVGSDFDVLIRGTSDPRVSARVFEILNSARTHHAERDYKDPIKRAFFPVADVKNYEEQIVRTMKQGGSALDWLCIDLVEGAIVSPSGTADVFADFIAGTYRYEAGQRYESFETTVLRGLRPLLELPHLRIADDTLLREHLGQIEAKLRLGQPIDNRAVEQIEKLVRNAREQGAHNRFRRAPSGSVEALLMRIVGLVQYGTNGIPEFLPKQALSVRDGSELAGFPADALLPHEAFRSRYTQDGVVFHGTSSPSAALAILRGSFFTSSDRQGVAIYGPGTYATANIEIAARDYAGYRGVVLPLRINFARSLHVLDWPSFSADPRYALLLNQLETDASQQNVHVFELLRARHAIDVIVHEHVIVQNAEAFELPRSLSSLTQGYFLRATNEQASPRDREAGAREFVRMQRFLDDLGEQADEVGPNSLQTALSDDSRTVLQVLRQLSGGSLPSQIKQLLRDDPIALKAERVSEVAATAEQLALWPQLRSAYEEFRRVTPAQRRARRFERTLLENARAHGWSKALWLLPETDRAEGHEFVRQRLNCKSTEIAELKEILSTLSADERWPHFHDARSFAAKRVANAEVVETVRKKLLAQQWASAIETIQAAPDDWGRGQAMNLIRRELRERPPDESLRALCKVAAWSDFSKERGLATTRLEKADVERAAQVRSEREWLRACYEYRSGDPIAWLQMLPGKGLLADVARTIFKRDDQDLGSTPPRIRMTREQANTVGERLLKALDGRVGENVVTESEARTLERYAEAWAKATDDVR